MNANMAARYQHIKPRPQNDDLIHILNDSKPVKKVKDSHKVFSELLKQVWLLDITPLYTTDTLKCP